MDTQYLSNANQDSDREVHRTMMKQPNTWPRLDHQAVLPGRQSTVDSIQPRVVFTKVKVTTSENLEGFPFRNSAENFIQSFI